ncbi:MAG: response regulator [Acidimicrobiales bacterium]
MTPIRVVVVDDHPVVRDGVRSALASGADIEVVGQASSGREAIELALQERPDVLVVDLHLPGGDGHFVIRELARRAPEIRCLVLTMDDGNEALGRALSAGARGYLVKGARREDIRRAVEDVAAGHLLFGPDVAAHVHQRFARPAPRPTPRGFPNLTEREVQLLDLLARGIDNATMARALGVSVKTVRNQLSLLLTKIGAHDRGVAVAKARDAGFGHKPPEG